MKTWGFDTRTIDKSVRPQDDFYLHANGAWLKKTTVPTDETRWGSFIILRHDTEKKLKTIVDSLTPHDGLRKSIMGGSPKQLVRDSYRAGMDIEKRQKLGTKPIEPWLALIRKVSTKSKLLSCIATLHRVGIDVLWGTMVDQDSKNSQKNILHLYQSGLGLPDRDYYLENKPEPKRVRAAYVLYIRSLFRLLGVKKKEAEKRAGIVMKIETRLAKASMDKVTIRDPEKTYHKKTLSELARHTPHIEWRKYFSLFGTPELPSLIVCQPNFFKEVEKLLAATPLEDLKIYVEWHLIDATASLLSPAFIRESFNFHGRVLMGTKKMKPLWRRALAGVNGSVGYALGQLYVKKHFTSEAKRKMDALVSDLFTVYEKRIKGLDWMSAQTKKKAVLKLHAMTRKIGYPTKWKSYKGLRILPDDYFGNALRVAAFEHKRHVRKLKRPVDRTEWHMSPQTVNAYFNPGLNEIVFPAAILQAPFFDFAADDAVNYGAIGYTIGHEITHGFDDQGSKFDAKGNLRIWWSKKDRARFEKKAKGLAKQFDQYEVLPGIHVNGKLTLGENIADLGGMSIAYDAYQKHLLKTGRKNIAGFTPEQRFFLGCAQGEREIARPEFLKTIVMTDPHSPSEFRVNGPFSNLPEFYEAFGVKKGDKLYRSPATRAKIW